MKIEIEFFDAEKVRPTESYDGLICIQENGHFAELAYSSYYDAFNCRDFCTLNEACATALEVKYWAYMPKFE